MHKKKLLKTFLSFFLIIIIISCSSPINDMNMDEDDNQNEDNNISQDIEIDIDTVYAASSSGCRVTGYIINSSTGRPVPNFYIDIYDIDTSARNHDFMGRGRTNTNGYFSISYPDKKWDRRLIRKYRFPDIQILVSSGGYLDHYPSPTELLLRLGVDLWLDGTYKNWNTASTLNVVIGVSP